MDALIGLAILIGLVVLWVRLMRSADEKMKAKGYSPGSGTALAFFLGIIGWMIAAALPYKQAHENPGPTRACPLCAETIKAEAVVCKHCGRDFAVTA